jgi:hypothetical protein
LRLIEGLADDVKVRDLVFFMLSRGAHCAHFAAANVHFQNKPACLSSPSIFYLLKGVIWSMDTVVTSTKLYYFSIPFEHHHSAHAQSQKSR